MKGKRTLSGSLMVILLLALVVGPGQAQQPEPQGELSTEAAVGTGFTYQGRITDGGSPANGEYDFRFRLYNAADGGGQVGSTVAVADKMVDDGLFTVQLDFGSSAFAGQARWLEVRVRPGASDGAHTVLKPRQALTAAPYALYATNVGAHDHWGDVWRGSGNGLTLAGGNTGLTVYDADSTGVHASGQDFGVVGIGGTGVGVLGNSEADSGVYGWNASSSGPNSSHSGVRGSTIDGWAGVSGLSQNKTGVYGKSENGYAGHFAGPVVVDGTLYKNGGGFRIDHPLDPENQFLHHSFIESPDMMNIYNGNVTLDDGGQAWVELPDWFEALNRDFRYQLTPIGAPGPNLHVAEEITGNRFKIAGGEPSMVVSWQVTGIRQDPYAEQNRIPVEEEKPADDRGTYVYPEGYGQPAALGLSYERDGGLEQDTTETSPPSLQAESGQ